ncbi:VOC family protein [Streptomyces olivoreticuli]|uniref:VOC family protein n=1 Tax=Streptomyces olivoreticuli TaxID=68246 RepID=UPI000E233E1B|nr:VOC family protein [Streptomyces olivoreticuli]
MANELNHIIVHVKDRRQSAAFVAGLMDTEAPLDWGPFTQITSSNGVGIDFADDHVAPDAINGSHLAYLVTDEEFDAIFERIEKGGVRYWADPAMSREGEINRHYGGRGVYVLDPGGTCVVEFITTPYGETPSPEVKHPGRM